VTGSTVGRVASIWRYPVKSMLGESLDACEVGARGLEGDRAFALIDLEDGRVASAKQPRKWGSLLDCRAQMDGDVAVITLADGSVVRSDDPEVDAVLSKSVGRDVRLAATAPADRSFEEVWPSDIDGLAPEQVIRGSAIGEVDGESVSAFPLGSLAPEGTFFDMTLLHVLTTATLERLAALAPDATFDVRRYRPNVLVEIDGSTGFVENDWPGRALHLGPEVVAPVSMVTMRCVMTTLAQGHGDLLRDRDTLRAIAAHNRVEIPGFGTWACAGAYADVAAGGRLRVGDPVTLTAPA